MTDKCIVWWGRFDPDYSRNRILRQALRDLGWTLVDFHPLLSPLGDLEARLRLHVTPRLVWVPCFRQRDLLAAARWAWVRRIPVLFDPLISAYDKQVFERGTLAAGSARAERLLRWERRRFAQADIVLADTQPHADFFRDVLGAADAHTHVIPVGAEDALFQPDAGTHLAKPQVEVLFYGSFIPLQGPEVIVAAARLLHGEPIVWHLAGSGPLRKTCERQAAGLDNVVFEDWMPYSQLPARIHRADILLGAFGATPKAGRVIPNKVYQALACGRPVVTQESSAYPLTLGAGAESGLNRISANDPAALAGAVRQLAADAALRERQGQAAYRSYSEHFSTPLIRERLRRLLHTELPKP